MFRALLSARPNRVHLTGGLGMVFLLAALPAAAEPRPGGREAASEAVREALQREIYGLASEREVLLRAAVERAPQYAPAQWHLGNVQDARRRWISATDYISQWTSSRRIKHYLAAREDAADSAAGQWQMAEFCRREGLPEQMRAHLTRVLEHDPNHEGARAALGFVRMGTLWLSRAEIEAEEAIARAQEASVAKWRSQMEEIVRGISAGSIARRTAALDRLRSLRDPSAIAALERIVSPTSDEAALAVIGTLRTMSEPEASLSLARHAVYYPSLPVREQASAALSRRDLYSYVPALLEMMVAPITSRIAAIELPGGRIGYRHAFAREADDRQDVLVLDTEYVRISQGGSRQDAARRAAADAQAAALRREFQVEQQNQTAQRLNDRVAWVLNRATQQDLPASPEAWWKWWNDQNEIQPAPQKTVSVSQVYRRVQIVDPLPVTGLGSGVVPGGTGGECLVAGTLVWTAAGPIAVERVQRGDLVLAQDVESGELAFKPVLRTTTRNRGPIVKFTAGSETVECSGGHVFWVAGEGWKKASQLESGMLLHTAGGPAPIMSIEAGSEAETYNLVVADFATYFVGRQKILSHDFTLRQATTAIVPGLKPE